MPKATTFATNLLKLLFNNTAYAGVGDVGGLQPSAAAGNLYVSLHTAAVAAGGDQSSSEATYTGYSRVAVARSVAGWSVAGGIVANVADIAFGACTAGADTIIYYGVGTDSAGAGQLLYAYPLFPAFYATHAESSGDLFHVNSGVWVINDPVQFVETVDGPFPTGISVGTTYYVISLPAADQIKVSTAVGGASVTITGSGFALIGHIGALSIAVGVTPKFSAGQLTIQEL
jgi:hypothetical protein